MAEVKLDEAAQPAKKQEVTASKTVTYRCVTKCYWNGKLYREGDMVDVAGKEEVPEHFAKAE